jgi:uncharacterized protein (UPF0264 family)
LAGVLVTWEQNPTTREALVVATMGVRITRSMGLNVSMAIQRARRAVPLLVRIVNAWCGLRGRVCQGGRKLSV